MASYAHLSAFNGLILEKLKKLEKENKKLKDENFKFKKQSNTLQVCMDQYDVNYNTCHECNDDDHFYPDDCGVWVGDYWCCDGCLNEKFKECDGCGEHCYKNEFCSWKKVWEEVDDYEVTFHSCKNCWDIKKLELWHEVMKEIKK